MSLDSLGILSPDKDSHYELLTSLLLNRTRVIGVYLLHNKQTGKIFVGSSGNLREILLTYFKKLRNGTHLCPELQKAYKENNAFSIKPIITAKLSEARELKARLINECLDKGISLNFDMSTIVEDRMAVVNHRRRAVVIDGVTYGSQNEAAAKLGVSYQVVYWRVNSRNFPTWSYLKKKVKQ